jgi:hypothetical protein
LSEPNESLALPSAGQNGAADFDFWLGSWRGTWTQDARAGEATNVITKDFGGNVVVENFKAKPPDTLRGMSVSVFDPREGCWKQTWVDDTGGYLDFRGGLNGQEMHLSRELVLEGEEWLQRMIFRNIEQRRFDWLWQRSHGNGSWETLWEISYERLADTK